MRTGGLRTGASSAVLRAAGRLRTGGRRTGLIPLAFGRLAWLCLLLACCAEGRFQGGRRVGGRCCAVAACGMEDVAQYIYTYPRGCGAAKRCGVSTWRPRGLNEHFASN